MKKRTTSKKVMALIITASLSMSSLTGCSLFKPTVESLVESYEKAMNEAKSADMSLEMDFSMKMAEGDMSVDIDMEADGDVFYVMEDKENFKAYTELEADVSLLGISQSTKQETYIVSEDGKVTSYSKNSDEEEWTKEEDASFSLAGTEAADLATLLTLQEETVEEAGRECYVLTGKVSGKDIPSFSEQTDLGFDFDDEDIAFDVTIKMDKKEKTPVQIAFEIDADSFNEVLKDALGEELGAAEASVDKFDMVINVNSLNEEVEVNVPDEVLDAKESDGDDDGFLGGFGEDPIDEEPIDEEPIDEDPIDEDPIDEPIDDEPIDEEPVTEEPTIEIDEESISQSEFESRGFETASYVAGDMVYLMVTNDSGVDKTVKATAIYQKDGDTVATENAYLDLEAGTSNVADYFPEVEFDSVEYVYEEYDAADIDLLGSEMDITYEIDEDGYITGEITNNSDKTASFPQIHVVLYNSDGEVIEHQYSYAESDLVAAGETSPYDMYIDNTDYDSIVFYASAMAE